MPLWMGLALLYPVLLGIVTVLDKVIVDRHVPSIYLYAFWIGVYDLTIGGLMVAGLSTQGLDLEMLGGGILAGTIRGVGLLLLLTAFRMGQLARVVPLWYLYPLMVAPLATGFLGEELSGLAWLAISLSVAGAGLVTWEGGLRFRAAGSRLAPAFALLAALTFAVGMVLSKKFLDEGDFWQFYASSRLGMSIVLLAAGLAVARPRALRAMVRQKSFMKILALNEVIISASVILSYGALALGPVSLVSAVSGIQPVVTLFYALGLSTFWPRRFGDWIVRRTIATQLAGIGAITAGVVLIALE